MSVKRTVAKHFNSIDADNETRPVVITFLHGTILFRRILDAVKSIRRLLVSIKILKPVVYELSWTERGSFFRNKLSAELDGCVDVFCERFCWSGGNSPRAREKAANELRDHVKRVYEKYPDRLHYIISHSHGGNIAVQSLRDGFIDSHIQGIVCLSTPFIHVQPRYYDNEGLSPLSLMLMAPFGLCGLYLSYLLSNNSILILLLTIFMSYFVVGGAIVDWLMKEWLELARKVNELFKHPVSSKPVLIIRTTGDEATGGLIFSNMITLLLNFVVNTVFKISNCISICLFIAAIIVLKIFPHLQNANSYETLFGIALITMALNSLGATIAIFESIIANWIHIFSGLGFGYMNLLIEVSAEATPEGCWTVHHFPARKQLPYSFHNVASGAKKTEQNKSLSHCAAYDNEDVVVLISKWIKGKGKIIPVSELISTVNSHE